MKDMPDWYYRMVEVHVPVNGDDILAAMAWCRRMGKTPNRRNVAEMLRYWSMEGIGDYAEMPKNPQIAP